MPEQANYSEQTNISSQGSENRLFMAKAEDKGMNGVWFVDSGCSNHMTGSRDLFIKLDETKKSAVKLGDDKEIKVEGMATVMIDTHGKGMKTIENVQFVPSLVIIYLALVS